MKRRCEWAESDLMVQYHDQDWGVPLHNDRAFFELLTLEGAQAGLSWETVLRKREGYRAAFDRFEAGKVASYGRGRIAALLQNPGIVRNRRKIEATVHNAGAFLGIQQQFGTFDAYVWGFVGGRPMRNSWKSHAEIPATTPLSSKFSADLKRHGFRFVGPTICYAFLQAAGLVNDHTVYCFRYLEVGKPPTGSR